MLNQVLADLDSRKPAALEGLKTFLHIPSVSAQPKHADDVRKCALWLASEIRGAGLRVDVMETGGHPAVVARNEHKPGRPTVLLYGHYDVQPPEPLELWTTPAFDPTVRKTDAGTDALYARGSTDDKGQVWAHVQAIAAWQRAGGLPVNLTVLIEGEEEIGSDNLERFVAANKAMFKADIGVISDTDMLARGKPAIGTGLRGLVYMEVFLTGPSHDLHSGGYGGAVPNPANVLSRLIASLHDENGRVAIKGFYDGVVELTPAERAAWAKLPFTDAELAKEVGIPFTVGEKGFTSLEARWARPTCDVNGLTSGYQGHGAKTVIASAASAKISMRLVANQDPQKVKAAFIAHLTERCPKNVQIRFEEHGASPAVLVPSDSAAVKLAGEAIAAATGHQPAFIRSGGSIPVVGLLQRTLGIDTLLVGYGLGDDRAHSPNEKFELDCFYAGMRISAGLYSALAKLPTKG